MATEHTSMRHKYIPTREVSTTGSMIQQGGPTPQESRDRQRPKMRASYKNNITVIYLLGFHDMDRFNVLLFILLLIIYCVTILGNSLIITLVAFSKNLHSPMYFFLTQLSIADILLTTDISPVMLNTVLHQRASISFPGCITQLYFFGLNDGAECFLLTMMSYDRYLDIFSPLHYGSIMNHVLCIKLIISSWLLGGSVALILIHGISQLHFCRSNTIDHFFCDFYPVMELSCSDVSMVRIEGTLMCILAIVLPFFVIVISYVYIASTILKISTFSGRQKSFSTCSSHLTVVSIFYGTLIATYLIPNKAQTQILSKTLSLLYTALTPLLNPFIYSLRNNDIKKALRKVIYNQNASDSKLWIKRTKRHNV
ncbi:PREDICTED: olfactory receptor 10A7-like [Nanorana parkeri]|uniref:olfactory receptor 10A7-like n=1 Tax=Nanorana parkeri TaxID=125878 RepID=UPI000853F231|nr:PREDICTED: olfactory receptor 10A7-like [Nanorana parkeri]